LAACIAVSPSRRTSPRGALRPGAGSVSGAGQGDADACGKPDLDVGEHERWLQRREDAFGG